MFRSSFRIVHSSVPIPSPFLHQCPIRQKKCQRSIRRRPRLAERIVVPRDFSAGTAPPVGGTGTRDGVALSHPLSCCSPLPRNLVSCRSLPSHPSIVLSHHLRATSFLTAGRYGVRYRVSSLPDLGAPVVGWSWMVFFRQTLTKPFLLHRRKPRRNRFTTTTTSSASLRRPSSRVPMPHAPSPSPRALRPSSASTHSHPHCRADPPRACRLVSTRHPMASRTRWT